MLLPEKKCGRFNSQAIRHLICCIKVMSVSERLLCTHSCGWCLFCTIRTVCCLICLFVVHISCDLWQVDATAKFFFFHSFTTKALQFVHVFSQGYAYSSGWGKLLHFDLLPELTLLPLENPSTSVDEVSHDVQYKIGNCGHFSRQSPYSTLLLPAKSALGLSYIICC